MSAAATDTLAAVRALGGEVKLANPGRLKVVAPAPLPQELIEQLRAAKSDLLTLLVSPAPQTGPGDAWTDTEEERAAIVEYDAGAPRAWAEGFARLDPNKPPADVPRGVGCDSLMTAAGSSTAVGPHARRPLAGGRSICLAVIGSGYLRAWIIRGCFGW